MVAVETLEGVINQTLWFHYDVGSDVLYLRLNSHRGTEAVGEETSDGFILLKDRQSGPIIGITIVNWWKRFGDGSLPDSLIQFERHIEPFAKRLAA